MLSNSTRKIFLQAILIGMCLIIRTDASGHAKQHGFATLDGGDPFAAKGMKTGIDEADMNDAAFLTAGHRGTPQVGQSKPVTSLSFVSGIAAKTITDGKKGDG